LIILKIYRPFMEVFHTEEGGMRLIGRIVEPY
jgi:hypothetical protein